jgi:hypothetical protein
MVRGRPNTQADTPVTEGGVSVRLLSAVDAAA